MGIQLEPFRILDTDLTYNPVKAKKEHDIPSRRLGHTRIVQKTSLRALSVPRPSGTE